MKGTLSGRVLDEAGRREEERADSCRLVREEKMGEACSCGEKTGGGVSNADSVRNGSGGWE